MSIDRYFAAEALHDGRWVPAREAVLRAEAHPPEHRATFAWLPRRHPGVVLFEDGPLRMTVGAPPGSPLAARYGPDAAAELDLRWCAVEELLVDAWDDTRVLLGASVPAAVAERFGAGDGPFPLDPGGELRAVVVAEPIDQRHGKVVSARLALPPERLVAVTWSASVAEVLGPDVTAAFRHVAARCPEGRVVQYSA